MDTESKQGPYDVVIRNLETGEEASCRLACLLLVSGTYSCLGALSLFLQPAIVKAVISMRDDIMNDHEAHVPRYITNFLGDDRNLDHLPTVLLDHRKTKRQREAGLTWYIGLCNTLVTSPSPKLAAYIINATDKREIFEVRIDSFITGVICQEATQMDGCWKYLNHDDHTECFDAIIMKLDPKISSVNLNSLCTEGVQAGIYCLEKLAIYPSAANYPNATRHELDWLQKQFFEDGFVSRWVTDGITVTPIIPVSSDSNIFRADHRKTTASNSMFSASPIYKITDGAGRLLALVGMRLEVLSTPHACVQEALQTCRRDAKYVAIESVLRALEEKSGLSVTLLTTEMLTQPQPEIVQA